MSCLHWSAQGVVDDGLGDGLYFRYPTKNEIKSELTKSLMISIVMISCECPTGDRRESEDVGKK